MEGVGNTKILSEKVHTSLGLMVVWLPAYIGKWAIWEKDLSWAGASWGGGGLALGCDKMLTSNVLGENIVQVLCADV